MKFFSVLTIITLSLLTPSFAFGGFSTSSSSAWDNAPKKRIYLAKKKKKRRNNMVRKKIISSEKVKKASSTNLDFDAVDIGGMRKTPLGTLVNQTKSNNEYDFVKIRMKWHPEMVQSAASLESTNFK